MELIKSKNTRYKYNVINRNGQEEPWTGVFESKELADKWYEKYGKEQVASGRKLVRHQVGAEEKS